MPLSERIIDRDVRVRVCVGLLLIASDDEHSILHQERVACHGT